MKKNLSTDRSKWLFVIGLVAITGSFSAKVLSHSFAHPCKPQEIVQSYVWHDKDGDNASDHTDRLGVNLL